MNFWTFLGGAAAASLLIGVVGVLDAALAGGQLAGVKLDGSWKGYAYATAWELSFLAAGIIIGKVVL